ncbi:MAG: arginine N-succinyltransferase [Desulfomonilaceae bacterium]|nr:arginine N-succinyltransferase [Desulfomonilaceae bacterium]
MVIIRPVKPADLDDLVALAHQETYGLTSLPRDARLLRTRILESLYAFQKLVQKPGGELYMFVMEDLTTGHVIGTSCIISKVGGFQPFYSYRIDVSVHESKTLGIRKEIPTLHLINEHSGPSEIGGLLLAPEYRKHGNGRLLSLFRFLFMAEYPERVEPVVIAEMRGVLDPKGNSAFWDALGRHFFDMDYPSADLLSAMDKKFIADLMPTSAIYIPLLPKEAQQVIGEVHEQTRPALRLLQEEGFQYTKMVDIFEAGPVVQCRVEDIRTVRESRKATVAEIRDLGDEKPSHIVCTLGEEFRCFMGGVTIDEDGNAHATFREVERVDLQPGDTIRFAPLRPSD